MTTEAPAVAKYRLVCQKRGAEHKLDPQTNRPDNKGLRTDQDRLDRLPDIPAHFIEFEGTHQEVSKRAGQLNEGQLKNNFLDYLYSPDPVEAKPAPASKL